jgi:hypothetical protein
MNYYLASGAKPATTKLSAKIATKKKAKMKIQHAGKRRYNPIDPVWDLGLAVLEIKRPNKDAYDCGEIARACGVSKQAVTQIVNKALMRVRPTLCLIAKEIRPD